MGGITISPETTVGVGGETKYGGMYAASAVSTKVAGIAEDWEGMALIRTQQLDIYCYRHPRIQLWDNYNRGNTLSGAGSNTIFSTGVVYRGDATVTQQLVSGVYDCSAALQKQKFDVVTYQRGIKGNLYDSPPPSGLGPACDIGTTSGAVVRRPSGVGDVEFTSSISFFGYGHWEEWDATKNKVLSSVPPDKLWGDWEVNQWGGKTRYDPGTFIGWNPKFQRYGPYNPAQDKPGDVAKLISFVGTSVRAKKVFVSYNT